MRSCRYLLIITAVLVALVLPAAPAQAGGPDWFGLHLGSDGFGLSLGFGNWAPYGKSWHDPHWQIDYHSALSGYGEWVMVSGLGQVWRPYVATDWRPFNHGRWVYTSYGWTWVSYEPWGYFPHHYGSWAFTTFGWVWSPGYTYNPGNVVWVDSGGYVGWYACPPHGWSHSHRGFHHSSANAWRNGYRHGQHDGYQQGYGDGYWDGWRDARYATFVTRDHLTAENLSHHALSVDRVSRTVTGASVRPMPAAPSRSEVGRWSGRQVEEVRMERRSVRTADREMTIARPQGIERSIERYGGETVDRALSRDVSSRFKATRGAMDRAVPTSSERGSEPSRSASRDGAGSAQPADRSMERQLSRPQVPTIDRSRTPQRAEETKEQSRSSRELSRSRSESTAIGRTQSPTRVDRSPAPSRTETGRVERSPAPTRTETSRVSPSRSRERIRNQQRSPVAESSSNRSSTSDNDRPRSVQSSRSSSTAPQTTPSRSSKPSVSRSTPSRKQEASSRPSADTSQSAGASKDSQSSKPKRQRR